MHGKGGLGEGGSRGGTESASERARAIGHPTFVIESVTAVSLLLSLLLFHRTTHQQRGMDGLPIPRPSARNSANPISARFRSQTPVAVSVSLSVCLSVLSSRVPTTTAFVFASLPFQTADKGQIIIDRVELSRFELKRRALPSLSRFPPRLIPIYPCGSCLK